jgi:acetylornithine deacetylase/succinyl-diaminopimelate desuccinylase-like protein
MSNWKLGVPALTTSLRGLVDCVVEVRTLDHAAHSGMFGGAIPDALSALARLLATLHDDRGDVAIPGLSTGPRPDVDQDEEEYRRNVGARPGVRLVGEGSITERLWMRPALSVVGVDAPRVAEASNQLVAMARAKVSLRLAPSDDPDRAMEALAAHLASHAPWGAEVRVNPVSAARPFSLQARGVAFDAARRALRGAWGTEPVDIGSGGSIPLMAALADAFPDAAFLLTGVEDPLGQAHAENESIDLGELERICAAEALLLGYLAQGPPDARAFAP